ncbi:MAG: LamG-like jellyroll fold domain-containing protein [Chloroflexota bacterium]
MKNFISFVTIFVLSVLIGPDSAFAHNYCKNGLIAFWNFDDGTARDVSGNNFHGTIMNTPKRIKGISGDAFYFTGRGYYTLGENSVPEGDHILLPKIPFNELGEFSITMWVKEDSMSNFAGEAYFFYGDHDLGWLGLMNVKKYEAADTILYTDYGVGASQNIPPLKQKFDFIERGTWIFYTMTYKNGVLTAFRDGKYLVHTNQKIDIRTIDIGAIARHWWTYSDGIRTSARFSGAIDEVKIFCKALTNDEVKKEFEELANCDNKDLDKLIIIESPKPQTEINKDLGLVESNQEISATINLKNKSDQPVSIPILSFKNNNFYFAPTTFPITILPMQTNTLKIFFKKTSPGKYEDEFKIKDICTEYTVRLNAEVKDNPCKNGLIAYWSFDDSTARDNSGNGYDGSMKNGPIPVKGYKGTGIKFHGNGNYTTGEPAGSYILLPNIDFFNYNEFTVSLAAKEESFSYYAGEAMLWFGLHNNGWLGLMTHNIDGDDKGDRYTHYSISSGKDGKIAYKAPFDTLTMRNKWIYYTMTYSNGVVKCYRDGIFLNQINQSVSKLDTFAAIGRHWWIADGQLRSSARYNGTIDEVKIYCKALTEEEIKKELINCENADLDELEITECPKPQKYASITFPSIKVGEETSSSIHIKNRTTKQITINSLTTKNNHFYFATGTFPLIIAPSYTVELKIYFKKNIAGVYQDELKIYDICSEYTLSLNGEATDLPCKKSLIAYWSFDDSTARDFSGNGFHGSIHNSPKFINGYKGACIELHGEGSYTTGEPRGSYVGLPSIPFEEYEEFTVSLFAKEESFSYYAGEAMIWFGYLNSAWLGMMTTNHAGNDQGGDLYSHFAISANSSAQNDFKAFFDPTVYRNNWINYTMTYSNGNVKCYRNGVFLGSFYQKTIKLEPYGAIGRHWWTADGETRSSTRYNGLIDEVKIYCRALTEEEIKKEYDPCALGLGNEFEIVDMPKTDSILTVQFDSVGVGKQCVRRIKIKNITEVPVILNSIYVAENIHFSIPQSQFPIQFAPQEIKEIEVYLIPKLYGKIRDTLIWDDKCNPWRIALDADSYGTPDTLNGICGTVFEARIDSIKTKYFMSLRSPRYSSSNSLVTVDFETNFEGTPMYRDIDLFNSLGDLVAQVQARVTYAENKIVNGVKIRRGSLSFSKGALPSGLYFIKSENGAVGMVIGE